MSADDSKLRLYCIVSPTALKAMKGVRGKFGAQTGHAFLHSFWNAELNFPGEASVYRNSNHAYKIVLVLPVSDDEPEVLALLKEKYASKCGVALIKDAAFTVLEVPTVTCLGIGPIDPVYLDEDVAGLKTLT